MDYFGVYLSVFITCINLNYVFCDDDNNKTSKWIRRPLGVGDILTPSDFLPIAKRLREKVPVAGVGKGRVSSSKSSEKLADLLFSAFFFSPRSLFTIEEEDLPMLNALQALALSGTEYDPDTHFFKPYTDFSPSKENRPIYCRYLLLTRNQSKEDLGKQQANRHKELIRKSKNNETLISRGYRYQIIYKDKGHGETVKQFPSSSERPVVISSKPKTNQTEKVTNLFTALTTPAEPQNNYSKSTTSMPKDVEHSEYSEYLKAHEHDENFLQNVKNWEKFKKLNKKMCYWKYMCDHSVNWCQLFPDCPTRPGEYIDDIPISHNKDEHDEQIKFIRDMIGVYMIDEEVEKILGHRQELFEKSPNYSRERWLRSHPDLPNMAFNKGRGIYAEPVTNFFEFLVNHNKAKAAKKQQLPEILPNDRRFNYLNRKIPIPSEEPNFRRFFSRDHKVLAVNGKYVTYPMRATTKPSKSDIFSGSFIGSSYAPKFPPKFNLNTKES